MKGIPLYQEINALHELTGSSLRTHNPLFHCFDMKEANDVQQLSLGPHRVTFYTLALNFGTKGLTYTLNENTFKELSNFVLCVAPGHVVKWDKQDEWQGYCIFFKSEFLNFSQQINFLQQYPFFNIHETNLIPLPSEVFENLRLLFIQMLKEQNEQAQFGEEVIKCYFQAILWQVRRLYESSMQHNPSQSAGSVIVAQFQYLVNEHFLEKISVNEYADLLHISANHLSQTVKKVTGRTAKSIINERRLNEARYLLKYTEASVGEISFHLKFSEPTHFVKSFKTETSVTPQTYRKTKGSL